MYFKRKLKLTFPFIVQFFFHGLVKKNTTIFSPINITAQRLELSGKFFIFNQSHKTWSEYNITFCHWITLSPVILWGGEDVCGVGVLRNWKLFKICPQVSVTKKNIWFLISLSKPGAQISFQVNNFLTPRMFTSLNIQALLATASNLKRRQYQARQDL